MGVGLGFLGLADFHHFVQKFRQDRLNAGGRLAKDAWYGHICLLCIRYGLGRADVFRFLKQHKAMRGCDLKDDHKRKHNSALQISEGQLPTLQRRRDPTGYSDGFWL